MPRITVRDKCRRLEPQSVSNSCLSVKARELRKHYCGRNSVLQKQAIIKRKQEVRKHQPSNLNTETYTEHVFSPCKRSVNSVTLESNLFMQIYVLKYFFPLYRVSVIVCVLFKII